MNPEARTMAFRQHIWKAEAAGAPLPRTNGIFTRFFAAGLAIATAAGGAPSGVMNINDFNHNRPMAQVLKPPAEAVTPVQQQAAQAVAALRDFIYSGNQQKKDAFIGAYQKGTRMNQPQAFADALGAEIAKQVISDPVLGPAVNAYRSSFNGKFYVLEFMDFITTVRDAALSNNADKLAALRDPSLTSVPFVVNVVEPFIKVCQQGQAPERQVDMQGSATEAASLFIGLLETVKTEPSKKYTLKEQVESRNQAKEISRQMLERFSANRLDNGSLQPGFLDTFEKTLREQCLECTSIITAFARDRHDANPQQEGLRYADLAELADKIPKLFSQLLAPGYNYDALSRSYGSNLTGAVRSYLIRVAIPVEEVASLQSLTKRLAEVEQFVGSRGLTSLNPILNGWKKRLDANPSREERLALHNEIPGVEMLEQIEALVISSSRRARAVLDGDNDFYRTIGTKIWVPRLQTLVTNLRSESDDPMTGKFAAALIAKENLDVKGLEDLAASALNVNTDISKSLATLDGLIRTTPLEKEQAKLDAISQLFAKNGQINRDIDALTDKMAVFYPKADRETLRTQVADRLMIQFAVPVPRMDLVAALRARYDAMATDKAFLSFRNSFTSDIDKYTSSLAASTPTLSGDKLMKQSRQDMATKARSAFQDIQLEYAYGIYAMLRGNYGKNWEGTLTGNQNEMAKVCAVISGMSTIPAPYATSLLDNIGKTMLRTYDDVSIAVIATTIASSTQMYVQGDYQHLLARYYNTLPDRIGKLFPDITAMHAERREPGYDVRIMTPAEDPNFADIFLQAANIRIRVPKRIYEEWVTAGIVQVARAPSVVEAATFSPDFLRVMGAFMDEYMLQGSVNLPTPYIKLPVLIQNLGMLAPDELPPVGEFISMQLSGDVTVDHQYTASTTGRTSTTATTINAAQDFVRAGASNTWMESYSLSEGTGAETRQVGTLQMQNLRYKDYNVNTMDFNFEQVGTRLQTIGSTFSGIAPKGAETAILFQRNETAPATGATQGEVTLTAHVYQRAANGSFILSDAVTLSAEEAQSAYNQAFAGPLQRLYAGGKLQPSSGDVIATMDGAVLFSGPFTSEYTSWDQFQGAGAALQVRQWGGYTDYEKTRSGRAAGAFGRFMPDKRAFWIGRLTAENVEVEADGKRKFYGEFEYLKADETEMRGFVGFAKNMTADDIQGAAMVNHIFGRDYLGMRYGGAGLGRLIRETSTSIETTGGGRIYGVSSDMLNGVVASAIYNTYAQKIQAQASVTLSSDAQKFYSQNTALTATLRQMSANDQARQALYQLLTSSSPADIQKYTSAGITVASDGTVTLGTNSKQWLQTYVAQAGAATQTLRAQATQMLVSGGVRELLSSQLSLETGAGWDILNNQGAALMNFDWTPQSDVMSDVGLRAYFITQDKKAIPIIGGTAGLVALPRTKLTGEAYYPGIGELRLRSPIFDFALGGGEIRDVAGGAHLGFRIPLTSRWTLGAATSLSSDNLKAEAKRLDQQEGITGLIFTMPYADKPGFRLANAFGSFAFIHQNEEVLGKEYGFARQWDATAGLNWLTARSSLTGKLGTQYWEATTAEQFRSMYSLTAGMEYTIRTLKASAKTMLINPMLSGDISIGTENVETATDKSARVNLRFNFKATTEF